MPKYRPGKSHGPRPRYRDTSLEHEDSSGSEERGFADNLRRAVLSGDVTTARRLVKGGINVDAQFWYRSTLLHEAVTMGNPDMVQTVLKVQADVNAKSKDGRTPLHVACRFGHREIVEQLLQAKANVNTQTRDGRTCLHIAIWRQHEDIAKLLLDSGANVNKRDEDGWTPLHWAAKNDMVDLVQRLLDRGAVVDARDKRGSTPLHACVSGTANIAIVKMLLQAGADINLKSLMGSTLSLVTSHKDFSASTATLILRAGFSSRSHMQVTSSSSRAQKTESHNQFRLLLSTEREKVPPLTLITRSRIRKQLNSCHGGRSILRHVDRLPLPQVLKDYLVFAEEFKDMSPDGRM